MLGINVRGLVIVTLCWMSSGWFSLARASAPSPLPDEFVFLTDHAPSIVQDLRYFGNDNVLGRPLHGYSGNNCIVRRRTAEALARVQAALAMKGLGLLVYDCYRPARAVRDLVSYAGQSEQNNVSVYHPNVPARDLVAQGYIARRSGHSTGLAVDVTLVRLGHGVAAPTPSCGGPRYADELDMGTGYDCFDPAAWANAAVTEQQSSHRHVLTGAMIAAGFNPYAREWWHFSLTPRNQAERRVYDFEVRGKPL